MRYEDTTIKVNGDKGTPFTGNTVEIPVSIPQFENYDEAFTACGREDGVLGILNQFATQRAPASFRTAVKNQQKKENISWDDVVDFAQKYAAKIRDWSPSTDTGPSRKKQHELIDSISADSVKNATEAELRAMLAQLKGIALSA